MPETTSTSLPKSLPRMIGIQLGFVAVVHYADAQTFAAKDQRADWQNERDATTFPES